MKNNMYKVKYKQYKLHWTIEEKVDNATGHISNNYYFKKRLCARIEINTKLAKQLAGYKLIEKDLRNIQYWLNEIKILLQNYNVDYDQHSISPDRDKFQIIKGLFVASVTFYGKMFTKAEGRGIKLELSWFNSEKLIEAHHYIMSFRHTYTAHSGENSAEKAHVVMAIDPVIKRNTLPELFCELSQPDSISYENIDIFLDLLDVINKKVNDKISKLSNLIFQEEIIQKDINKLRQKIKKIPKKHLKNRN